MGDISPYFNRSEFACKCGNCRHDAVDTVLIKVLDMVRKFYDSPVKITSGNRCKEYNTQIGGSSTSRHVLSKASDIQVEGVDAEEVYKQLNKWYPDKFGIILYPTWVHFDVREGIYRSVKV